MTGVSDRARLRPQRAAALPRQTRIDAEAGPRDSSPGAKPPISTPGLRPRDPRTTSNNDRGLRPGSITPAARRSSSAPDPYRRRGRAPRFEPRGEAPNQHTRAETPGSPNDFKQ